MSKGSHSFINVQLGFVPSRPMEPVTNGRSSGTTVRPSSALATPAPRSSAAWITSSRAPSAPCATSIATFSPWLRRAEARVGCPGRGGRIISGRLFGKIVGNDQRCHGPLIERNAMRTVDEMPNLCRVDSHLDVFVRDVLEEGDEVDFLLIVPAEPHPRLLTDDREHGLVIELRVIQTVEQVDFTRSRGREANADFAGPLRVRARHEGGLFLVPHLHELQPVLEAIERADDGVDAVARVAVDARDPVLEQTF